MAVRTYDLAQMASLIGALDKQIAEIESSASDITGATRTVLASFEGRGAADAFSARHDQWHSGTTAHVDELKKFRAWIQTCHDNYQAAEQANMKRFDF